MRELGMHVNYVEWDHMLAMCLHSCVRMFGLSLLVGVSLLKLAGVIRFDMPLVAVAVITNSCQSCD